MAETTYTSEGTRTQSGSYVYDPASGTWIPVSPTTGTPPSSSSQNPEDVPSSSTGGSSSQVDSKNEADKEYIETEFNTLLGEMVVIPSKKTVRLKVNDTVNVEGLGSYLSGKYFVSAVKRTLNSSGYSQTLTVIKNGFGDSLKKKSDSSTGTSKSRLATVSKSATPVKVGDRVRVVGNAIFITGEKIPSWVKNRSLTVEQISSDGSRVLLMPISSWTYSRYVQKA